MFGAKRSLCTRLLLLLKQLIKEELSLKGMAIAIFVKESAREKVLLHNLKHYAPAQTLRKPMGERGFPNTDRSFDRDIEDRSSLVSLPKMSGGFVLPNQRNLCSCSLNSRRSTRSVR